VGGGVGFAVDDTSASVGESVVGAGEGGAVGASLNGLSLSECGTYFSVGDAVGVPVGAAVSVDTPASADVGCSVGSTVGIAVGSGVG